jgi:NADH dehydrogenase FAD-containing subunit
MAIPRYRDLDIPIPTGHRRYSKTHSSIVYQRMRRRYCSFLSKTSQESRIKFQPNYSRMSRNNSEFKVAIIGGGISGIAQAVTLKRQLRKSVNIKVSVSRLHVVHA